MRYLKFLLPALFLLCTLTLSAKEETSEPVRDLSGNWKVIMSNSLTRRQVTFAIEHKDGRLRGKLLDKTNPEFDLDGRVEKGDRVMLWGRYVERTGASVEYQYKGKVEGEVGNEILKGRCDYLGKRYDFIATRGER